MLALDLGSDSWRELLDLLLSVESDEVFRSRAPDPNLASLVSSVCPVLLVDPLQAAAVVRSVKFDIALTWSPVVGGDWNLLVGSHPLFGGVALWEEEVAAARGMRGEGMGLPKLLRAISGLGRVVGGGGGGEFVSGLDLECLECVK